MKKLSRAIGVSLLLSVLFLGFSMTACAQNGQAAVKEGISSSDSVTQITITEKNGILVNGFTYSVDDTSKTITIKGKGKLSKGSSSIEWGDFNTGYALVLSDGITGIADDSTFGFLPYNCSKVWLGKDVQNVDRAVYWNNWLSFEVSPDSPYYASYHDCLYSKDYSKLIVYSKMKAPNDFHPNLSVVGVSAFRDYSYSNGSKPITMIIPWGVTEIGSELFSQSTVNLNYVIPDTALRLGSIDEGNYHSLHPENSTFPFWIPSRNNTTAWELWSKQLLQAHSSGISDLERWKNTYLSGHTLKDIPYNNIASYYGITPNSLKTFQNGKTYYFDQNCKMAKAWKQVSGNWYYFNDYGAAVVKIWLKSGNKWYFMQADGTMATNKWIQWYSKWYYVGSDGAMYVNRYTPDGYWVNGSGVWAK